MASSISSLRMASSVNGARISRRDRQLCVAPRATYQEHQAKTEQRNVRTQVFQQQEVDMAEFPHVEEPASWISQFQQLFWDAPSEKEPWMDVHHDATHRHKHIGRHSHIAERMATATHNF